MWADTFTGRYHLPPEDMPRPATVLDLGANIGLTAAHYAHLWPDAQVVAVELDEECAALARENAPGVPVESHAVSARGGWGWYDPTVLAEAFAFTAGETTDRPEGRTLVSSYTLRQTIRRSFMIPDHAPRVDFVKMDVEGEEWAIFERALELDAVGRAGWPELVSHLLVELHGDGGSEHLVGRAVGALTELGFDARHHPPHPQAVYAWRRP